MTSVEDENITFKTIVVGTDFEPCSQRAVSMAANMVKNSGGQLIVVHAFELPVYPGTDFYANDLLTPIRTAAEQQLNAVVQPLLERGFKVRGLLSFGSAWQQILRTAEESNADLILVGTHGRQGLKHALLGSVAEKVVRMSPVPVLTVREKPGT